MAHMGSRTATLSRNRYGYFREVPFAYYISEIRVELDPSQISPPTDLFKDLFAVELVGARVDKPMNSRYYTLRFAGIQKIHQDRTFKDTVSLVEIQKLARRAIAEAVTALSEASSDPDRRRRIVGWMEKICGRNLEYKCNGPEWRTTLLA